MSGENKGGKTLLYGAIILLLLIIIALLLVLLLRPQAQETGSSGSSLRRDPNAAVGQYEGKSIEEIQEALNKIVEQGMFNISINSSVTMVQGEEAELRIENIQANHHLMQVTITLDGTGETIYSSGLIEPGYYIQSVPLDKELEPGEHLATATFTAYDMDTEAEAGKAAARISITVTAK